MAVNILVKRQIDKNSLSYVSAFLIIAPKNAMNHQGCIIPRPW